jgi:hypothetical protein
VLAWSDREGGLVGIFDVHGRGTAEVPLPDGLYQDLYGGQVQVLGGRARMRAPMAVLRYSGTRTFEHEHSLLLDNFYQVELGDEPR